MDIVRITNPDNTLRRDYKSRLTEELDISNLSPGTYYVRFFDKNGEIKRYFKKLIVLK